MIVSFEVGYMFYISSFLGLLFKAIDEGTDKLLSLQKLQALNITHKEFDIAPIEVNDKTVKDFNRHRIWP